MSESPGRITALQPILAVPDVEMALAFYRDVLGFSETWTWGEPPTHGGAGRDHARFQFTWNPERAASAAGQAYWLSVHDIDALYAFHQARGANVVSPLEPKPWGVREYTVSDLNGYLLRFAAPADTRPQSGGDPLRPWVTG
jgi:Uncharacterized protein conserved in bacteria